MHHNFKPPFSFSLFVLAAYLFTLSFIFILPAFAGGTVEKCVGSDGKWRYATRADQSCQSSITTLNKNGVVLGSRNLYDKPIEATKPDVQRLKDELILRRFSSLEVLNKELTRKLSEINVQRDVIQTLIKGLKKDMALLLEKPESEQNQLALSDRSSVAERYEQQDSGLSEKTKDILNNYRELATHFVLAKHRF